MWGMIKRAMEGLVDQYTEEEGEEWNIEGLYDVLTTEILRADDLELSDLNGKNPEELKTLIVDKAHARFQEKLDNINNKDLILEFEKVIILRAVDTRWTDHIDAMDQLRQGVGLRAYAQNNPLVEYQTEGYERFNDMISGIEYDATRIFMNSEIRQNLQRQQV